MKKLAFVSVLMALGCGLVSCDGGSSLDCSSYAKSKAAFENVIRTTESCDALKTAENAFYDATKAENFPDNDVDKAICVTAWITDNDFDEEKKAVNAWKSFDSCESDIAQAVIEIMEEVHPGSTTTNTNPDDNGQTTSDDCNTAYSATKAAYLDAILAVEKDVSNCDDINAAIKALNDAAIGEQLIESDADTSKLDERIALCAAKWEVETDKADAFVSSKAACANEKDDNKGEDDIKCDAVPNVKDKYLAALEIAENECEDFNAAVEALKNAGTEDKVITEESDNLDKVMAACSEAWEVSEDKVANYQKNVKACVNEESGDDEIKCDDLTNTKAKFLEIVEINKDKCDDFEKALEALLEAAVDDKIVSEDADEEEAKKFGEAVEACYEKWGVSKEKFDQFTSVSDACLTEESEIECDSLEKSKAAFLKLLDIDGSKCEDLDAGMTDFAKAAAEEKAIESEEDSENLANLMSVCSEKWESNAEKVNALANALTNCDPNAIKCDELKETKAEFLKLVALEETQCKEYLEGRVKLVEAAIKEKVMADENDAQGLTDALTACANDWSVTQEQSDNFGKVSTACAGKECELYSNTKNALLELLKITDCSKVENALSKLDKASKTEKLDEEKVKTCSIEWMSSMENVEEAFTALDECENDKLTEMSEAYAKYVCDSATDTKKAFDAMFSSFKTCKDLQTAEQALYSAAEKEELSESMRSICAVQWFAGIEDKKIEDLLGVVEKLGTCDSDFADLIKELANMDETAP